MKKYRLDGFNGSFLILWVIIFSTIWTTDDSNYPVFLQKVVSWTVLLGSLIVPTYYLCNRILPKYIERSKVFFIVVILLGISVLQGFILSTFEQGMYLLEDKGIFPVIDEEKRATWFYGAINFLPLTFLINLGFAGLKFYFQHVQLYQQHLSLQKAHLETQLQSLQSQINPHFMFNVLNHIHILIHKNTELASSLLLQYADILRYQLDSTGKDMVNLKDELVFMKNYIDVEKYRWENVLDVNCSWKVENQYIQIPPLLFVIFIENAFKHVSRSKLHKGYVKLLLEQKDENIFFELENSRLPSTKPVQNSSKIGLENVKKRLQLQYPDNHSLIIEESDTIYRTRLTLTIDK